MLIKHLCFVLLLACSLLLGCEADPPEDASNETTNATPLPPRVQVSVSEALVFSHPSREATVLFRLIEGDTLNVLAQTEPDSLGGRWFQVAQGESFGWLAEIQVQQIGDFSGLRTVPLQVTPANLPTAELPPTATPILQDAVGAVVNSPEVPVYSRPGDAASVLMHLAEGETAEVLGRSNPDASGTVFYFLGQNSQALGWVSADKLTLQEADLAFVPLVADAFEGSFTQNLTQTAAAPSPTAPSDALPPATETIEALPTPGPQFSPTFTPTPNLLETAQAAPTQAPAVEGSATSTPASPQEGFMEGLPPPFQISLPPGWQQRDVLIPVESGTISGDLAVSLYRGPLAEGVRGLLYVIWGFPNISPNLERFFEDASGDIDLFVDGVQLLKSGVIVDPTLCTIGLDTERQYSVGGRQAVGTIFAASPCLDGSDFAGFFAVLQVGGGNFAFYVGVEPVSAVGEGLRQMQQILDTVQFDPSLEAQE